MSKGGVRSLQFSQGGARCIELSQITTQDGIDESSLRLETFASCKFDGFVDGGMVWNAVEPKNLVQPQPQKVLEKWFLDAALRFAPDKPIQRCLPANDAIGEFLA